MRSFLVRSFALCPCQCGRPGGPVFLKWIDIPPIWLAGFMALTWVAANAASWALPSVPMTLPVLHFAGGLLVGAGLLLIILAILEMRRARTTPIPKMEPAALVTSGIFGRTRNPIYLGDVLVLIGVSLRWGWPGLVLVPLFMAIIVDRFIKPEEATLQSKFGPEWTAWSAKVRRWM